MRLCLLFAFVLKFFSVFVFQGTDITEAFETHHLNGIAETILPEYYIKNAQSPRNSPFTFEEHGFYRTLKAKVALKVKELPKGIRKKSDMVTDSLLVAVLIISSLCCRTWNNLLLQVALVLINGFLLSALTTCAHNYFHRKDSWRMYLFNVGGLSYS